MKEEFKGLLERGVRADIFLAEQSFFVFKTIGERAEKINSSSTGYGPFFKYLQYQSQNSIIMALGRAFDNPSKKYPTRCFMRLVDFLEQNAAYLPAIVEKPQLFTAMEDAGFSPGEIDEMRSASDLEITSRIAAFFRKQVEAERVKDILNKAKDLRDKMLAHNEDTLQINSPAGNEVLELIDLGQKLIGIVGWAYFSFGYIINGEYILSNDAQRVSIALGRLIEEVT